MVISYSLMVKVKNKKTIIEVLILLTVTHRQLSPPESERGLNLLIPVRILIEKEKFSLETN